MHIHPGDKSHIDGAMTESSILLTPQIITGAGNLFFHVDWENIIKFTSNILGPNIGNSIAGIMIQDVKDDVATADQGHKLSLLQIKDERILIVTPEILSSLLPSM